jgi:hypothetical protein
VVEEEPAAAVAGPQAGELGAVGEQAGRGQRERVHGRHRVVRRPRPAGAGNERARGERPPRGRLDRPEVAAAPEHGVERRAQRARGPQCARRRHGVSEQTRTAGEHDEVFRRGQHVVLRRGAHLAVDRVDELERGVPAVEPHRGRGPVCYLHSKV